MEARFEAFATVSRAFMDTHAGKSTENKVFFARIVVEDGKEAFRRLGVDRIPYIARIPPALHVRPTASISIPSDEVMSSSPNVGDKPKDIGAFVQERTGLNPGDLSAVGAASRSRFLPLVTLIFVGAVCYIGFLLSQAPFMRWPQLYALGAVVIYWFSTSGGMFNIIRNVPMVGYDRQSSQSIVFTRSQGQMGAEGYIMGSLYTLFGLLLATFVWLLPSVKNDSTRRVRGWVVLGLMALTLRIVLYNHEWKTYMRSHWYFFE